ncbi:MAG: L-ribulose-5-phosphate 4-epimerase [Victivallaceae bacterium]
MDKYKSLKQEAYEANMQLPELGLVIYTFGNVSAIDRRSGVFAIKPSGVPYDELNWRDLVVMDVDGQTVEGKLRPSSDAATHAVLYRSFEFAGGIAHTHSAYAASWAQTGKDVPVYGTTHADHLACDVPCTEVMSDEKINGDYERETGRQIVERFERGQLDPAKVGMVLVAAHGPFTWSANAAKAVYNSRVLEEICKMALFTRQLDGSVKRIKNSLLRKHYERKHGANAYYGQNR